MKPSSRKVSSYALLKPSNRHDLRIEIRTRTTETRFPPPPPPRPTPMRDMLVADTYNLYGVCSLQKLRDVRACYQEVVRPRKKGSIASAHPRVHLESRLLFRSCGHLQEPVRPAREATDVTCVESGDLFCSTGRPRVPTSDVVSSSVRLVQGTTDIWMIGIYFWLSAFGFWLLAYSRRKPRRKVSGTYGCYPHSCTVLTYKCDDSNDNYMHAISR